MIRKLKSEPEPDAVEAAEAKRVKQSPLDKDESVLTYIGYDLHVGLCYGTPHLCLDIDGIQMISFPDRLLWY